MIRIARNWLLQHWLIRWNQNIGEIRAKAEDFLTKIDTIVDQPYQAADLAALKLQPFPPLAATTLVNHLVTLSTALLNKAIRLDLDNTEITLALQRVMTKRRPSHEGHIKDSINFEHYLELARQLRAAGFAEEVVFVSKNRKDYWDGQHPRIHPALAPEITDPAVRIEFFGTLAAALGFLHI